MDNSMKRLPCPEGAKVVFWNVRKGDEMKLLGGGKAPEDMSMPVVMVYNGNSSVSEAMPLMDSPEHGVTAGENVALGMTDVSARPLAKHMYMAKGYEDDLALPLGQQQPVAYGVINATQAVLAAEKTVPDMDAGDRDKLYRYLAYGDEIHERMPYEPLSPEDIKYKAMMDTGYILNAGIEDGGLNGELLFDLDCAVHGGIDSKGVREQYGNGGVPLFEVPAVLEEADEYLKGPFSGFMENVPSGKRELAEDLTDQWAGLDEALGGGDRCAMELAFMHMACREAGWYLVPNDDDAHALSDSVAALRKGERDGFVKMLERSLVKEHEQFQAQKNEPDRMPDVRKGPSALEKMRSRISSMDSMNDARDYDVPEM